MRGSYQPFSSWKSATNMWSVKIWPKPSSLSLGLVLSVVARLIRIGSFMGAPFASEDDRLAVQAEDLAVHVGDLAQRPVVLDRVDQARHHVVAAAARLRELLEPLLHARPVARALEAADALDLLALHRLVDLQVLDRRLLGHRVLVDADRHLVA